MADPDSSRRAYRPVTIKTELAQLTKCMMVKTKIGSRTVAHRRLVQKSDVEVKEPIYKDVDQGKATGQYSDVASGGVAFARVIDKACNELRAGGYKAGPHA